MGAPLLVSAVDALAVGRIGEVPQDEAAATYAPRLTRDEGAIDWARPALDIHNQIRGLHPWPLASSYLDGRRFILRRSTPRVGETGRAPGTVVAAAGDRLTVAAGTGAIDLVEIQPEGRRPMGVRDFIAGYHPKTGDRFNPAP